jgi:hypothetical protein
MLGTGPIATNAAEKVIASYITPVQEDALVDTIFAWDITATKG